MFCSAIFNISPNYELWHCPKNGHLEVHKMPRTLEPTMEPNCLYKIRYPQGSPMLTSKTFDTCKEVAEVLILVNRSKYCDKCKFKSTGTIVAGSPSFHTAKTVIPRKESSVEKNA